MSRLRMIALAAVAAHLAVAEERPPAPVEAVAGVDLARYAGLWYEIVLPRFRVGRLLDPDLADDYSYALVGSPSRKYLWVLARQPTLEAATYAGILKKAGSMGFDVTRVVRTPPEQD